MNLEQLITLADAAKMLGYQRRGRKLSVATLHRWARHGLRGIRLQTVRLGGQICTTRDALEEFLHALSGADNRSRAVPQQAASDAVPKSRSEKLVDAKLRALCLIDSETSSQRGRGAAPRQKNGKSLRGRNAS